jgi:hypothetical protein
MRAKPKIIISRPTQNAMQSGKANTKKWLVEFEALDTFSDPRFIENLMGWTGSGDTNSQIKVKFNSKDDAIKYAERNGYEYRVIEPKKPKLQIKSYTSNFTKKPL